MTEPSSPRRATDVVRASAWMVGALVSFSMVAIAGREAGRAVGTLEIMFWRSLIGLVIVATIAAATGGLARMRSRRLGLHTLRSIVHFGAQFSWLHALGLMPLAQLFALEFTAPLWTAMLAPLLIGERLTATRMAAALIGFSGMLIVVRPGAVALEFGSALALASAIGFALTFIATKRLITTDSPLQILLYMSGLQTVYCGALVLATGMTWPAPQTWVGLLGVAVCGLTAHYSLAKAFASADAIIVAPMDLLRLPLIALAGVLLYAEPLDPWVLAGGAVVVLGNTVNLWGERHGGRLRPAAGR